MRAFALALAILLPVTAAGDDVRTLVAQLGAEDAAARDAAQRGLEALGKAPLDGLREALSAATDPEVRSRLEALVEAIEGEAASFDAIPPDHVAELSPSVHAFHGEWAGHKQETGDCHCRFDSIGTLVRRGALAIGVLRTISRKIDARCSQSLWGEGDPDSWPPAAVRALIPEASSADCPGLDDLGPLYAELVAGEGRSCRDSHVREALLKQKSLGATTALLAWVRATREPLRAGLTGGCTGTAAPLFNDVMSVERAIESNGDKRLVPALVELLDADDVSQSFAHIEGNFTVPSPTQFAIEVLRKLTGQEFPYDGLAPSREKRAEGIDRVRAWCEDHAAK